MLFNLKKIKNVFFLNPQKSVLIFVYYFRLVPFSTQHMRSMLSSSMYFNKQSEQNNAKILVEPVNDVIYTESRKIKLVSTEEKFQNLRKYGLGHYDPYTRRYSNVDYSSWNSTPSLIPVKVNDKQAYADYLDQNFESCGETTEHPSLTKKKSRLAQLKQKIQPPKKKLKSFFK